MKRFSKEAVEFLNRFKVKDMNGELLTFNAKGATSRRNVDMNGTRFNVSKTHMYSICMRILSLYNKTVYKQLLLKFPEDFI